MDSYLTPAEVEAIQHLPQDTPYLIGRVSHGMLSVARHYGGCEFDGANYYYMPQTDELIRADVLKAIKKMRKAKPQDETTQALQSLLDLP